MLDRIGFDLWAEDYDRTVGLSDEENTYPFAGYQKLLARIYEIVLQKPASDVLDLGFGTGVLTAKLYEAGCGIYGQDFSPRMVALAREKMPKAVLVTGDFSGGLAPALRQYRYDAVVATYSLHHLSHAEKLSLLRELLTCLKPGGQILIGDVAFADQREQEACRAAAGEAWDEEETYIVFEEMKEAFPAMTFEKMSECAALLTLSRPEGAGKQNTEGGITC